MLWRKITAILIWLGFQLGCTPALEVKRDLIPNIAGVYATDITLDYVTEAGLRSTQNGHIAIELSQVGPVGVLLPYEHAFVVTSGTGLDFNFDGMWLYAEYFGGDVVIYASTYGHVSLEHGGQYSRRVDYYDGDGNWYAWARHDYTFTKFNKLGN